MNTPDVFDMAREYAERHGTTPKLAIDNGIWMAEVDCPGKPEHSGTGFGASPQEAYAALCHSLQLGAEA